MKDYVFFKWEIMSIGIKDGVCIKIIISVFRYLLNWIFMFIIDLMIFILFCMFNMEIYWKFVNENYFMLDFFI